MTALLGFSPSCTVVGMAFQRDQINEQPEELAYDSRVLAMLRNLYPDATDQELIEGKQNLEDYLDLAWGIAERLEREDHTRPFDSMSENSYDESKGRIHFNNPSLNKS